MDPQFLVQQLADRDCRGDAIRGLVGGVTATGLGRAELDDEALAALAVEDGNAEVRAEAALAGGTRS